MPKCPTCHDVTLATYTRWLEMAVFTVPLLAASVGFWLGRKQGRTVESTPFIQARVEGGPGCLAVVRYGVGAEKGADIREGGEKWCEVKR